VATYVIKQFLATINSGSSFRWFMHNANPPFPAVPFEDRQPNWIVEWQAVPIFFSPNAPPGAAALPGIRVDPVSIVEEQDTSQTHAITIVCSDFGSTGVGLVVTYVLYAVFFDVS
jgi:hypothetical protein